MPKLEIIDPPIHVENCLSSKLSTLNEAPIEDSVSSFLSWSLKFLSKEVPPVKQIFSFTVSFISISHLPIDSITQLVTLSLFDSGEGLKSSLQLLYKEAMFKLPIEIDIQEANIIALDIIKYVYKAFNDEEVYSNTDQEITYRILPETKRFINFSWDGSPQLGLFRVRQTVTVNDKVSVNEKLVFLCPVWLLFLVIFGVIFMIIWLFVRSRARRKQL